MPSQFDQRLADDWDRAFSEFKETVIRRVGGQEDKTEDVEAVVDDDHESVARFARGAGLIRDESGERLEKPIAIEIAASQANTQYDHWVRNGELYKQRGEAIGEDGGSKTIICERTKGVRASSPRTNNSK